MNQLVQLYRDRGRAPPSVLVKRNGPCELSTPTGRFQKVTPQGVARFMATFYLLPSPRFLGQAFERQLHQLFPGLHWEESTLAQVVDQVSAAAALHPNVYL